MCMLYSIYSISLLIYALICVFTDVRDVFDLFDFWDGRDGLVDGDKVGDFLRCCGMNPTNELVKKNGGCEKTGTGSDAMSSGYSMTRTILIYDTSKSLICNTSYFTQRVLYI